MLGQLRVLGCSLVLVFKACDVWPTYTAAQLLHLILYTVPLVSSFKIECNNYPAVYISQTSHALKTRTKEHSKAAACFDKNSQMAQHSQKIGHSFDFENVSILHICPQWNQRLFLEAWYSNKEENSINEHVEFPRVYLTHLENQNQRTF